SSRRHVVRAATYAYRERATEDAFAGEAEADSMPGKQLLQVADAATWESNVLRVVFGARDDARRERRRQSHLLPLVELWVLEGREALDLIQERTREPRLLDEDTLGENRADFARQRLIDSGWSWSSGRRSLPGHLVFLLALWGEAQADDLASGACFPGDGFDRQGLHARQASTIRPLVCVGNEAVIDE